MAAAEPPEGGTAMVGEDLRYTPAITHSGERSRHVLLHTAAVE